MTLYGNSKAEAVVAAPAPQLLPAAVAAAPARKLLAAAALAL